MPHWQLGILKYQFSYEISVDYPAELRAEFEVHLWIGGEQTVIELYCDSAQENYYPRVVLPLVCRPCGWLLGSEAELAILTSWLACCHLLQYVVMEEWSPESAPISDPLWPAVSVWISFLLAILRHCVLCGLCMWCSDPDVTSCCFHKAVHEEPKNTSPWKMAASK